MPEFLHGNKGNMGELTLRRVAENRQLAMATTAYPQISQISQIFSH
jgi:hypothetical protein